MESVCIISLMLDVKGIFDSNLKISEYKVTRETNKKVFFQVASSLEEVGKLKTKFNKIDCDLEVNRLQIKAICYAKDKEMIKNQILALAKEEIEYAKNSVNKLEDLFNNITV